MVDHKPVFDWDDIKRQFRAIVSKVESTILGRPVLPQVDRDAQETSTVVRPSRRSIMPPAAQNSGGPFKPKRPVLPPSSEPEKKKDV